MQYLLNLIHEIFMWFIDEGKKWNGSRSATAASSWESGAVRKSGCLCGGLSGAFPGLPELGFSGMNNPPA